MSFDRFFQPRSIAVIGGGEAEEVVRQLTKAGYSGDIWPVHPKKETVGGLPVFRSVDDLPASPDAAYIAVNRNLTIDVVRQLANIGAGGAICYANGFSEAGEAGVELEKQLLAASGSMTLLGPNCYGMLNYLDNAPMWPDQHGGSSVESGVAIITQSSNVALNLSMQQRGLPVSYVVSLGNRVKFDLADAIRAFASQERVTAIGLYLEGISDPFLFEQVAQYAKSLNKPIVAIKTGRSDAAKQIAMSHTASLSGSDELINALFQRSGVGRVYSMDALIETLKILHVHGPLAGHKLGAMSPSGGDGALIADAAESLRLQLTELSPEDASNIKQTVHEQVTVSNPFDYQLFDWSNEQRLTDTFSAFIGSDFDLSLCLFDYPRPDRCSDHAWMPAENALVNAVKKTGKKAAVLSMIPEGMPEAKAKFLMSEGIVPLANLDAALEAINAAADIGSVWQLPKKAHLLQHAAAEESVETTLLDEAVSKQLLASYGLSIPDNVIVSTADQAKNAASELGFPLVVKGLGVAHKTEVGAVKLGLTDADAVAHAVNEMAHLSDSFLIEKMVDDIVAELIIGVVSDEQFGPYLVVGAGGILVELMKDSQALLLPVTRDQVQQAILDLKSAPLLLGFRGRPMADIDAAVDAVMAVANFASEYGNKIKELDINPLLVRSKGHGAVAADALLHLTIDLNALNTIQPTKQIACGE